MKLALSALALPCALAFAPQPLTARSVAMSNFINPTSAAPPLPTAPPVAAADDADGDGGDGMDGDGGDAMDLDLGDMFELADAADAADGEAAADEAA